VSLNSRQMHDRQQPYRQLNDLDSLTHQVQVQVQVQDVVDIGSSAALATIWSGRMCFTVYRLNLPRWIKSVTVFLTYVHLPLLPSWRWQLLPEQSNRWPFSCFPSFRHQTRLCSVTCTRRIIRADGRFVPGIKTRGHSVGRTPQPRHIEIGIVSLPTSSRCVRVMFILAVVPVQPQTCAVAAFYPKLGGYSMATITITTEWYPEHVPDHFINLKNSSLAITYLIPYFMKIRP